MIAPLQAPRRVFWGVACAVVVLGVWSSFILIGRASAIGRHTLTPFDIVFLRLLFSGVVIAPVAVRRLARGSTTAAASPRGMFGNLTIRQAATLALTAGVGYCSLVYSGFFYAPAAHGAVLVSGSLPLWTTLGSVWLLGERPTAARAVGLVLIAAGDALVGGASLLKVFHGGDVWKGDLIFLGAAITWSTYTVLCRKWRVGPMDSTVAIGVCCLLTYVPLYAIGVAAGAWPSRLMDAGWRELTFQAVYQGGFAMLIAGPAYTQVIATFGPARTVMITAAVPVLAALSAVPILHEPLGFAPLGGLACVTAGLLTGLRKPRVGT